MNFKHFFTIGLQFAVEKVEDKEVGVQITSRKKIKKNKTAVHSLGLGV